MLQSGNGSYLDDGFRPQDSDSMTYQDAIAYWFGRINYEVRSASPGDLKLERMRALLRQLGNPHERVRTIHITGTKGKGSTAAMIAAGLQSAGYRVGLFTSPHLVHVEERIQVNGTPIGENELTAQVEQLAKIMPQLEHGPWAAPTFFEMSTAIAFSHFVQRRADFAVVEVGLGGRFDSTNVCEPILTVITSVGLDHMAQLGNRLEEIAYQKAGIIKRGIAVISGVLQPGPRAVIEREAKLLGSRLLQLGEHFGYDSANAGTGFRPVVTISTPKTTYENVNLRLLGEHQAGNAAIAVMALDTLQGQGIPVAEAAMRRGLAEVYWPARIEVLRTSPTLILDTAHNLPSVQALVSTLAPMSQNCGTKAVVFAVSSDKQYEEILGILAEFFDEFHLTRYGNNPRSVAPEHLAVILRQLAPGKACFIHASAVEAWTAARTAVKENDLLCVTGSVFLAGELRDLMMRSAV
jgi:dihydrofolate synthase / folylpolyglutamate synthase